MASSLKDIVESIYLEAQSIDSIFRNKERYMMYRYAKEGMKKLQLTFGLNIVGMNAIVPASCKLYKPLDFQKFIRAYLIDCSGHTIEIKINNSIPEEIRHYLRDCDGSILSDHCGGELYDQCLVCNDAGKVSDNCGVCCGTGKYLSDESLKFLGELKKYKNSWIAERSDYFEFSADLEEMAVVVEYVSNQLADISECKVMIPDDMEEALDYYIKYKILEGGMETAGRAQEFKRLYKAARDVSMRGRNALQITDIYNALAF